MDKSGWLPLGNDPVATLGFFLPAKSEWGNSGAHVALSYSVKLPYRVVRIGYSVGHEYHRGHDYGPY